MWPVSPIALIHEKMQRRHLARLRRTVGVTGLELPDMPSPWPFRLCVLVALVATCAGFIATVMR